MKKALMLSVLVSLFLIASMAMVSATTAECGDQQGPKTLIAGKIYDSANFETADPVADATVHVTCKTIEKDATSKTDGTYSVTFCPDDGCIQTTASAYAEKGGVTSNTQDAQIQDYTTAFDLYLGVINIALIPEFGFFIGGLTLLSAIGVFFLVRRK